MPAVSLANRSFEAIGMKPVTDPRDLMVTSFKRAILAPTDKKILRTGLAAVILRVSTWPLSSKIHLLEWSILDRESVFD